MGKNVLTIQPAPVKNILRLGDCPFTTEGVHQNILLFSSLDDFQRAGRLLLASGFMLLSQKGYAHRHGLSKQLVSNWVLRDGRLTEIVYDDGARFGFVVDSV